MNASLSNKSIADNDDDYSLLDEENSDKPPLLSKFQSRYIFLGFNKASTEKSTKQVPSWHGYIPIKPSDEKILSNILQDSCYSEEYLNSILQQIFLCLSPYDICISFVGMKNMPLNGPLAKLCNTPDPSAPAANKQKMSKGTGKGGGGGSGRGSANIVAEDLPTISYIIEAFEEHNETLFVLFCSLFFNALKKGHILALLCFFRCNLNHISGTALLKMFVHFVWTLWADDLNNHIQMRHTLKTIVSLLKAPPDYVEEVLLNSYSGCEIFYAAWNFPPNPDVRSIYNHIEIILTKYKIDVKQVGLFKLYMIRQIFNCVHVGDRIQYFDGKSRPLVSANHAAGTFKFFINICGFNLPLATLCKLGCYSYYSSKGIINPLSKTVEPSGPFLNNKLYRDFHGHFGNEDNHLFHPNSATYHVVRDIFFKTKHYMDFMHTNVVGFICLSPLINVSIASELYHFQSAIQPVINTINVLITDLPAAYNIEWPKEIYSDIIDACKSSSSAFGKVFSNFLALMITLHNFSYFRYDPMTFIHMMFGSKRYQYQGLRKHTYTLDNCIRIKCDKPNSSTSMDITNVNGDSYDDFDDDDVNVEIAAAPDTDVDIDAVIDNVANETDDFIINNIVGADSAGTSSSTNTRHHYHQQQDDTIASDVCGTFFNRINRLMLRKTRESCAENLNNLSLTRIVGNYQLANSFREEDHRKKLTSNIFIEYFKYGRFNLDDGFILDFETIPFQYIKLCVVIFSWLLRMGDTHKLTNTPIMEYIIQYRNKIYQEFEKIILNYFPIDFENITCDDHTKIFRQYCESIELDFDNVPLKDKNDIPPYRPIINGDLSEKIYKDECLLTNEELDAIYTGYSYLIIFSNFDYDQFVELCKMIASFEYPGNFLKRMYLFYGNSMGGKNVFVENMKHVFHAVEKIQLQAKYYSDSNVPDQNKNKEMLGTSFFVNLDEPADVVRASEIKTDVNIDKVSTRPILSRFYEEFPIMAKMLITSNVKIRSSSADEGFLKRLHLFNVRHTFCEQKDLIDRNASQNSGELFHVASKYLVCQIKCACYPNRGNSANLITGLVNISYIALSRLFYHKPTQPVSFALTDSTRRLLYDYMMANSFLFEFINSIIIVPSDETTSVAQLNDFLSTWCSDRKKSLTPTMKDTVKNHLVQFFNGKEYNCRIQLKNTDVYTAASSVSAGAAGTSASN